MIFTPEFYSIYLTIKAIKTKSTVNCFFFDNLNLLKLAIKFVEGIVEKLLKELLKNFKVTLNLKKNEIVYFLFILGFKL